MGKVKKCKEKESFISGNRSIYFYCCILHKYKYDYSKIYGIVIVGRDEV